MNKNLKLREEIAMRESRTLPVAPVSGLEYVSTRQGWCRKSPANEGGTTRVVYFALRPLIVTG